MEDLKHFLNKYSVNKGDVCSHTTKEAHSDTTSWPNLGYYIPDKEKKNFWIRYCNAVKKGGLFTITERPTSYAPLRIDLDFVSTLDKDSNPTRIYTYEDVKAIVKLHQDAIRQLVNNDRFSDSDKIYDCIVLEKPAPRLEDGKVKDGIHIHFPHFLCEPNIQDEVIYNMVNSKLVKMKNLFTSTSAKLITPLNEIIDKGMAKKPWLLYGGQNYKNNLSKPYMYNNWSNSETKYGIVYNSQLKSISIKRLFGEKFDELREVYGTKKMSIRYFLPILLSVRGAPAPTPLKELYINKATAVRYKKPRIVGKRSRESILADFKTIEAENLMGMLSPSRADSYTDWMTIGWILFNIGEGMEMALDAWILFSRQSAKFIEGACQREWSGMKLGNFTIGSLRRLAKIDSPSEYRELSKTHLNGLIEASLEEPVPTETDVSKVFCKLYDGRFRCADGKDKWYEFRDHRWREVDGGVSLRKLFATELIDEYSEFKANLLRNHSDIDSRMDRLDKTSDEFAGLKMDAEMLLQKIKKCRAVITKLKQVTFHDKLMRALMLDNHDEKFDAKLNENTNILVCENGVIDLELGAFRAGLPDDYATFTTGIDFVEFKEDDSEMVELRNYLEKVYPNPNIRKYFLDFTATCMKGGNINKRFVIATGESDGAKSMTFKIIEGVFGTGELGYFGKFPRESLTNNTGSNSAASARPEMARVKGKRVMGAQELTKNEKMNVSFIKEATGNDSFFARGLYSKGGEITPQYTLMMQCNEPPSIPGHDEALWSRVRLIDHESKFVKPQDVSKNPVPETHEEQMKMKRFHADPDFRRKLPDIIPAMMFLLFKTYLNLKKNNLVLEEPDEVIGSTENYKSKNDVFIQFKKERIGKILDVNVAKDSYISLAEIFSEFTSFYSENYPGTQSKIGKMEVKKEMEKLLGTIKAGSSSVYGYKATRFYGYEFISEESVLLN